MNRRNFLKLTGLAIAIPAIPAIPEVACSGPLAETAEITLMHSSLSKGLVSIWGMKDGEWVKFNECVLVEGGEINIPASDYKYIRVGISYVP